MLPEEQEPGQELILQKKDMSHQATDNPWTQRNKRMQIKHYRKTINDVRESDLSTEESKMTFILENFETDKMEILNQDGKLTEEAVKLFKFSGQSQPLNIAEKQIQKGLQQEQLWKRRAKYRI